MIIMIVALLADTAWLDEELSSFQYLTIGLIDEQVKVVQVLPQGLATQTPSMFCERISWSESRWSEVNRWRMAKLAEALERAEVDLIHAMDSRLWRGALAMGQELEVPVILNAPGVEALDEAPRLARLLDPAQVAFAATTEPIAQALRQAVGPEIHVETIPTGIHVGEDPPGCAPGDALCAIVTGDGAYDQHYEALLRAMVEICQRHPQTQFFFDGQGSDQHDLWRAASRMELLPNLSLIPRRLGNRDLLLRADVLLQPQPLGRSRSTTLQAMAHALTVIAHQDPWLDYLIHDTTAWLLDRPSPKAWEDHLENLIARPDDARALGQRARAWMRENRPVSTQLSRILDLYRRFTGQTLQFKA